MEKGYLLWGNNTLQKKIIYQHFRRSVQRLRRPLFNIKVQIKNNIHNTK